MKADYAIAQKIKNGDEEVKSTVIKNLKGSIENLKSKYNFLQLTDDEFYYYVEKVFYNSVENYPSRITRTLTDFFRTNFNKEMGRYISSDLAQNKEQSVLNRYVQENLSKASKKEDAYWELCKLNEILGHVNYKITSLINLVKTEPLVSELIAVLLGSGDTVDTKKLAQASKNKDGILSLFDAYCMVNNIEVTNTVYEEKDKYFNSIDGFKTFYNSLPPDILRAYQLNDLLDDYHSGSREAYEKLVYHNCHLLANIAKDFTGRGLYIMDLIDEGYFGLDTAIKRFDVSMGNRFSTFATWWIKQAMHRAIGNQSRNIRLPIHKFEDLNKFKKDFIELSQFLGTEAKAEDFVVYKNYTFSQASSFLMLIEDTASLDAKRKDDETSGELYNFVNAEIDIEEDTINEMFVQEVRSFIASETNLTEREKEVLSYRFGLDGGVPLTLEETGERIKNIKNNEPLTRERVRQIEAKALNKLRYSKKISTFADYMDNPQACLDRLHQFRTGKIKKMIEEDSVSKQTKKSKRKTHHNLFLRYTDVSLGGLNTEEEFDAGLAKICSFPTFKAILIARYGYDIKYSDGINKLSKTDMKTLYVAIKALDEEMERLLIQRNTGIPYETALENESFMPSQFESFSDVILKKQFTPQHPNQKSKK